ncbi:MAG TPA: rod-binding protein [Verrucomicrobiae bacterium]|jgi:Rod binding domain-containing protein|nr:rod-binding protein [Verrucomicrobiae bacterium]
MNIPALKPHVVASDISPERLAKNPQLTEHEKIAEASRQFESILLKQILDGAQKTVIKSKFSDDSTASGIYHDMITQQLADSISKSGTFGLAKTFEQQLNRPETTKSHQQHAGETEVSHKKTISAGTHAAAQPLKPFHERTLTKPD